MKLYLFNPSAIARYRRDMERQIFSALKEPPMTPPVARLIKTVGRWSLTRGDDGRTYVLDSNAREIESFEDPADAEQYARTVGRGQFR